MKKIMTFLFTCNLIKNMKTLLLGSCMKKKKKKFLFLHIHEENNSEITTLVNS